MTEYNKQQLIKRLKSFAWRLGVMVAIAVLSFAVDPDTVDALREAGIAVPAIAVTIGGLILGEVTKFFNRKAE